MSLTLRAVHEEGGVDQTLMNLLRALLQNLELQARYRLFTFEAGQDGREETAQLFRELGLVEREAIERLISELHHRLGDVAVVARKETA